MTISATINFQRMATSVGLCRQTFDVLRRQTFDVLARGALTYVKSVIQGRKPIAVSKPRPLVVDKKTIVDATTNDDLRDDPVSIAQVGAITPFHNDSSLHLNNLQIESDDFTLDAGWIKPMPIGISHLTVAPASGASCQRAATQVRAGVA